jgi:Carbohydrate phosphorylase
VAEKNLLDRFNVGRIKFFGGSDALYERHLTFDQVTPVETATPRDKFEAVARSIRDVLSQRWLKTEQAYQNKNVKRVYYVSLEFLIGRSLANNITNLMLDPIWSTFCREHKLDPLEIVDEEPDAGLGNGGLGRLAACFLDSMATLGIPGIGSGLRYEYGIFKQSLRGGWQHEQPDRWLARPDPWEVARPNEAVEVRLACSFDIHGGALRPVLGRPSTLIGLPYDRPVVGYGGRTINTLRLWSAATPDYFDFQQFSGGDFVGALAETLTAETLTRVLYPDDSTSEGKGLRFLQQYFLVACTLADAIRRFRAAGNEWSALPDKVAIQLNDTHPTLAVPELMRILLDEAKLGWDEAWDLTTRTLAYTNHTLLPEALEKWPLPWFEMLLPRQLEIIYEINRRFLETVRARFPGDDSRVTRVSLIVLERSDHWGVREGHLACRTVSGGVIKPPSTPRERPEGMALLGPDLQRDAPGDASKTITSVVSIGLSDDAIADTAGQAEVLAQIGEHVGFGLEDEEAFVEENRPPYWNRHDWRERSKPRIGPRCWNERRHLTRKSRHTSTDERLGAETHAAIPVDQPAENQAAVRQALIVRTVGQPIASGAGEKCLVLEPASIHSSEDRRIVIELRHLEIRRDHEAAFDALDGHGSVRPRPRLSGGGRTRILSVGCDRAEKDKKCDNQGFPSLLDHFWFPRQS